MHMYCGNEHSQGGKNLAAALGINRIRHAGSKFVPGDKKKLINWGTSGDNFPRHLLACTVLNSPAAVLTAANKLLFFEANHASNNPARVPDFTTDQQKVQEDLRAGGNTWVARQTLTGHSGHGIIIMSSPGEFVKAPLYTKYIRKMDEYRVHIVKGEVIDVQRKARDRDNPNPNWQVRSHANGFIFVRGDANPHPDVLEQAKLAFRASGLDFGAVDVIWNAEQNKAYVLEINTAPGLEGQTVENYAKAFRKLG